MIQIVRDRSKARPIFARVTSLLLLGTVFLNGCLGSAPPTTTTSTSTQDFSYDKLGQLIGISVNSTPSASFQFDPSGNLVSLTSGGTTSAFTYNSLNQPTTPAGTTFDAKGQTTASGGKTFEWDDEGRLTAIVNGSARSEFGYDGYGRRISITEKSGATITSQKLYWWLGGSIVCERDGLAAGNPITKRYFGQGVLVGAQKLFYTFDQLGSVRELVDDTGAIRADYRYDTYGTRTKSAGDLDSDFGYAGLFHHAPSGLLLATHRAYDPVSHRWLSRDPLGEGVDLNLYRYCGNSSPNYSDPSGLGWLGVTAYIRKPAPTMIVVDPIAHLATMPFPALEWFTNPVLMMHVDKLTCDGWTSTNIVSVWSMTNGQLPAIMRGVGAFNLKEVSIDIGSPEFKDAIGIRIVMELKARDQHNDLLSANLVHVERLPASKPSPNGQKCGCPR